MSKSKKRAKSNHGAWLWSYFGTAPVEPSTASGELQHSPNNNIEEGEGVGMTPGCLAVCSRRRLVASCHFPLPFA